SPSAASMLGCPGLATAIKLTETNPSTNGNNKRFIAAVGSRNFINGQPTRSTFHPPAQRNAFRRRGVRLQRGMLGLDFAPASSAETDLNLARVVGGRVTQTEQNRDCPA